MSHPAKVSNPPFGARHLIILFVMAVPTLTIPLILGTARPTDRFTVSSVLSSLIAAVIFVLPLLPPMSRNVARSTGRAGSVGSFRLILWMERTSPRASIGIVLIEGLVGALLVALGITAGLAVLVLAAATLVGLLVLVLPDVGQGAD